MNNPVIQTIRTRRAIRSFSARPIAREDLECVLDAGRWAPSAGNRRLQKFIVLQKRHRIEQLHAVSPGMHDLPPVLIIICTDWKKAQGEGLPVGDCNVYIDVGTAAENLLLAAHALGLGAGPVTSFSKEAVKVLLDLPQWLSPDMFICLGYAADQPKIPSVKSSGRLRWQDLTIWEP